MTLLISLAAMTGLLILVFGLYNDYRVDRYRQCLFELRDELFDAATSGRIAFDSPSYRVTRAMLNGMIRFGHKVSFSGIVLTLAAARRSRGNNAAQQIIDEAFAQAGEQDRALCQEVMKRAHVETLRHLASSPTMILLVLPSAALLAAAEGAIRGLSQAVGRLDAPAYSEGVAR